MLIYKNIVKLCSVPSLNLIFMLLYLHAILYLLNQTVDTPAGATWRVQ